jgi:hypothetical protein
MVGFKQLSYIRSGTGEYLKLKLNPLHLPTATMVVNGKQAKLLTNLRTRLYHQQQHQQRSEEDYPFALSSFAFLLQQKNNSNHFTQTIKPTIYLTLYAVIIS